MKTIVKRVLLFAGSGVFALTSAGVILSSHPQIASAQPESGSVDPLQDFNKPDGYDPFSSTGGSGVAPGFFGLVHKAIQGSPPPENLESAQGKDLEDATANFRAQQQQRLQQQSTAQQPAVEPLPPATP
jgi:hypothetical protein